MAQLHKMQLDRRDSITTIENSILRLVREIGEGAIRAEHSFSLRIGKSTSAGPFHDIWASLALASLSSKCGSGSVVASGYQSWSGLDEVEPGQLNEQSLPFTAAGLFAVEAELPIVTDNEARQPLDARKVMDLLARRHFMLGRGTGRERIVVETDPDHSIAPTFASDYFDFERFKIALLDIRREVEVGSELRGMKVANFGNNELLSRLLFEIRQNGYEHARNANSVRLLKLKKWAFNNRPQAAEWAAAFPELKSYIETSFPDSGPTHFYEASISDFGEGILDSFLHSARGRSYEGHDRANLIENLLHTQLSSKTNDPNAGKGIEDALWAAQNMGAFVSLRTGEFWKFQDSRWGEIGLRDCGKSEELAKITGTHWQIIYPGQPADRRG